MFDAGDGIEGLRVAADRPVDLVITDVVMPEMEGIGLIRELRKLMPAVRILAISGGGRLGPEDYLAVAKAVGADETLMKPFGRDRLLEAVDLLLDGEARVP